MSISEIDWGKSAVLLVIAFAYVSVRRGTGKVALTEIEEGT